MNDEAPVVTPINTGLAEKVRQKAEAEKARLRALMPSSATTMVESKVTAPAPASQITEGRGGMPGIKRPNTGLLEKTQKRIEEEKSRLKAIMPSALNEDAAPPVRAADASDEHEPTKLNWAPVSHNEIASKYPKDRAISDLKMVLNAALQQPEMAFGLVGKLGTSFLVKTDKTGQFYMCEPDNNPKNFHNPGLNTDLDNDAADDAHAKDQMTPDFRRAAFGNNTLPGPKDNPPLLCYEDIEKEFGQLINFDLENKKTLKDKTVNEGKQQRVKLSELNNLLFDVQKQLKLHENKEMEKLANTLSSAIAESILSNSKSYSYDSFCNLVNKFVEITEG